jgi:hypothetical protein
VSRRLRVCAALFFAWTGCEGRDLPAGEIAGARRAQSPVAGAEKEILFGDLHVHTTYSIDAFLYGLPLFGGEGTHPPADACDFARYCSRLDFFSLNDHAEGLTGPRWRRSIESVRECNARAGDPGDPDLVAYMGWEWTQSGLTPDTHFGHKNVIFPGLADDELPTRPISALADDVTRRAQHLWAARGAEAVLSVTAPPYGDFLWWIRQLATIPHCESGVDVHELPADCLEGAADPAALFEKLAQWRLESLVIPHGLAWGIHAPPASTIAAQLTRARHDPERQRLLEVYSGHGAGERYSQSAARADDAAARGECAAPSPDYLPCCWQAGEIVRARCADPGSPPCQEHVEEARRLAVEAGRDPQWVLPDAPVEAWLDCDQVRGEFKSALSPRPYQSAQVALALENASDRDANGDPLRFRFGLIASSDTHSARAGSGYKQVARKGMTDARGFSSERAENGIRRFAGGDTRDLTRAVPTPRTEAGFRNLLDVERGASFLYPGGLVAVHASARDRRSIWDALVRREVYATSGPRILLWFDLLNGPDGRAPMGASVVQRERPRFEVRAVGSFVQQPGLPRRHARGAVTRPACSALSRRVLFPVGSPRADRGDRHRAHLAGRRRQRTRAADRGSVAAPALPARPGRLRRALRRRRFRCGRSRVLCARAADADASDQRRQPAHALRRRRQRDRSRAVLRRLAHAERRRVSRARVGARVVVAAVPRRAALLSAESSTVRAARERARGPLPHGSVHGVFGRVLDVVDRVVDGLTGLLERTV